MSGTNRYYDIVAAEFY